jgi:hypothetical protein
MQKRLLPPPRLKWLLPLPRSRLRQRPKRKERRKKRRSPSQTLLSPSGRRTMRGQRLFVKAHPILIFQ